MPEPASATALHVLLLTPSATLLDAAVSFVVAPTLLGYITVLPQHVALLCQVVPGVLELGTPRGTQRFQLEAGLLEVSAARVTIFADTANAIT